MYKQHKNENDNCFTKILLSVYDKLDEICVKTDEMLKKDIQKYQRESENLKKELKKYSDLEKSIKILQKEKIDDKYEYIKISLKLDEFLNQEQNTNDFETTSALPLLGYYLNPSNLYQCINKIVSRPKIDFKATEIQLLTKNDYELYDPIKFKIILKNFNKEIVTSPFVDYTIMGDQSSEIIKYQNVEFSSTEMAVTLSAIVSKSGKHTIVVKIESKFVEDPTKLEESFKINIAKNKLSNSWQTSKFLQFEKDNSIFTSKSDKNICISSIKKNYREKSYRYCIKILKPGNFDFGIESVYFTGNEKKFLLCKMFDKEKIKDMENVPIEIEIKNEKEEVEDKKAGEGIFEKDQNKNVVAVVEGKETGNFPIGIEANIKQEERVKDDDNDEAVAGGERVPESQKSRVDVRKNNNRNPQKNIEIKPKIFEDDKQKRKTKDIQVENTKRMLFIEENDEIEMIVNNSKQKFIKWTNLTTKEFKMTKINNTASVFKTFLQIFEKNTSIEFVSAKLIDPYLK